MALRDSMTPNAAELAAMAVPTPDDVERAKRKWRTGVTGSLRTKILALLLDAKPQGNVGPATGPLSDSDT